MKIAVLANISKEERKRLLAYCICGLLAGIVLHLLVDVFFCTEKSISWNGGTYYGDTENGVPNGDGRFEKDGVTYSGFWTDGAMTSGRVESGNYVYEGELKDMKFDGYGVCKYKDGHAYWGYWKEDYKHGLGRLQGSDGNQVFCLYKNGVAQIPEGQNYNIGDKIYGIDVSRHQGVIDWQDLYLSCNAQGGVNGTLDKTQKYIQPVLFSISKSTEGSTHKDTRFESNYNEAKRCGLVCGAYHFLSMKSTGEEQARFFIKNTPLGEGDFPPVLDLEKVSVAGTIPTDEDFSKIIPIAKDWLKFVEEHYHAKPIIYTSMNIYETFIRNDEVLNKHYLWLAKPGIERPDVPTCIIWQFTHSGKAGGITESAVDINLFNGNYNDIGKYVIQK